MLFDHRAINRERPGEPEVIAIKKREVFPFGLGGGSIPSGSGTGVWLLKDLDAGGVPLENL